MQGLATSQETFGNRMGATHQPAGNALYQSMVVTSPGEDDFDVDREQPREEKKFEQMINISQTNGVQPTQTLTTVNEQETDYNDTITALNRDNAVSSFQRVAELGTTAKRD